MPDNPQNSKTGDQGSPAFWVDFQWRRLSCCVGAGFRRGFGVIFRRTFMFPGVSKELLETSGCGYTKNQHVKCKNKGIIAPHIVNQTLSSVSPCMYIHIYIVYIHKYVHIYICISTSGFLLMAA